MISVITQQRHALGGRIAAYQNVRKTIIIRPTRQRTAAPDRVALEVEAFDRALFRIGMDAIAVLIEDQVINDFFRSAVIL